MSQEREVRFAKAWDDLVNECDHGTKGDHGRGSVEVTFILRGDPGTVVWQFSSGWHLPETYERGRNIYGGHIDWRQHYVRGIGPGFVELHSRAAMKDSLTERVACDLLEGPCWVDVTYLASKELEEALIRQGSEKVWEALAGWLEEMKGRQQA